MTELQCLRNYYAKYVEPGAALITAGVVCLTCQHLLTRYARNRSLLSQLMLLMLLTVTIIASPSLPHVLSLSLHPPCLLLSGLRPFCPRLRPLEGAFVIVAATCGKAT